MSRSDIFRFFVFLNFMGHKVDFGHLDSLLLKIMFKACFPNFDLMPNPKPLKVNRSL